MKNTLGRVIKYCSLAPEYEETDCTGLSGYELDCKKQQNKKGMVNVFATQNSVQYYKTALNRLKSGTLKMINFADTELYKNKIDSLDLESLKAYDISALLNTKSNCESANTEEYKYKYNASYDACHRVNVYGQFMNVIVGRVEWKAPIGDKSCAGVGDAGLKNGT